MSIALESVYANDVESKVTTNNTESPYQCVDVCSKDIPSETTAQKFRKSSSTTKLLALLGLITFLMFIALLVMPFALQSSWRQDAKELEENWEQVVNRITANLTRMKGDMDRRGERISKLQNKTEHSIRQLNESADNLLNQLKVGKSMRSLIEANINAVNDSVNKLVKLNGWHQFGNFAYKPFAEAVTSDTAGKRCHSYGGRLAAAILSDPDAVRHMLNQKYVVSHADASGQWIGFNDIQREGSWKWIDGGEMNPETTRWNTGEPNEGGGAWSEDCGHIVATLSTKILLNDAPCSGSTKYPYICEIEIM